MGTRTEGLGTHTGYLGTAMVRTLTYHEQCCRTGYFIIFFWVRLVKMVRRTSILGTAMVRPVYKTKPN